MNITVFNSGCGLGDMLGRINIVYKISQRYRLNFFMPEMVSRIHENDYCKELGFEKYPMQAKNWQKTKKRILLTDFLDDSIKPEFIDCNTLYEVSFTPDKESVYAHNWGKMFEDIRSKLGLDSLETFDYSKILDIDPSEDKLYFLVHLRLGDSYIYSMCDGRYFNAAQRQIVEFFEQGDDYEFQWTINDVNKTIDHFKSNKLKYKIICDGIGSALNTIRLSKKFDIDRSVLEKSIHNFYQKFLNEISDKNHLLINSKIRDVVELALTTENIICTKGSFIININNYFVKKNIPCINIKKFLKNVL